MKQSANIDVLSILFKFNVLRKGGFLEIKKNF